eukprot:scaffold624_cov150-Cylindrotheca_fusiformis.AAC.15
MSSFPYKLHQLLTDVESNKELSDIISWLPTNDGFRIHKPVVFEEVLLKKFFPKQSKIKSFKRQLQYYGFESQGKNSYGHHCFRKGRRSLCGSIIHRLPAKHSRSMKEESKEPLAAPVLVTSMIATDTLCSIRQASVKDPCLPPHTSSLTSSLLFPKGKRIESPLLRDKRLRMETAIPQLCKSHIRDCNVSDPLWQEIERTRILCAIGHRAKSVLPMERSIHEYWKQLLTLHH